MSIYAGLAGTLAAREGEVWKVGFAELERAIGRKLPASAWKYPAWWSNNPSNNAMTKVWLRAGWRTEQVDVPGQTVVFRRVGVGRTGEAAGAAAGFGDRPRDFEDAPPARAPETGMARPPETKMAAKAAAKETGSLGKFGRAAGSPKEKGEDPIVSTKEFLADLPGDHPLVDLFGFVEAMVTFAPDFDPCAPAYTPEEWAVAEAEMEAEWNELYGPDSDLEKAARKGAKTP